MLKPQDVLVALKLVAKSGSEWSYPKLAVELFMSPSEVHAAVRRATTSGLLRATERHEPNRRALLEFLIHGVKYAFPAVRGGVTRGIPTAHAGPPLNGSFTGDELPPVWADAEGTVRGEELEPLYPSVPKAAKADEKLYELLALLDAIRGGRARERELAEKELAARLR